MKDSAPTPQAYYAEYFKPADHGFVRVEPIWKQFPTAKRMSPKTTGSFGMPGGIDGLVAEIEMQEALHLERGHEVSVGVYATGLVHQEEVGGKGRTTGTDAIGLTALTLDVDCAYGIHKAAAGTLPATDEEALAIIEAFPLPPSAVMRSGGGLYVTWFLDEMVPVHDNEKPPILEMFHATMQRIFTDADRHLDKTDSLTQVYRCPGTTNTKAGRTDPTEVVLLDPERRYTVDGVFEACDVWRPPVPPTPDHDGPTRPGDAYNAEMTVEDIEQMLTDHGFHTPTEVKAGRIDMVRPSEDADHRQAISIFRPAPHGGGMVFAYVWSLAPEMVNMGFENEQRGYSPFELKARLDYGSDYSKCAKALAVDGYGDGDGGVVDISHLQPIDFTTLRATVNERPTYWVEPLFAFGRGHAVLAKGGDGKSLELLEVAAAKATGRAVLDQPEGEPEHIVYLDMEMTEDDLVERLDDMGFDFEHDEVLGEHLHYYLLQDFAPLDTKLGGDQLLAVVELHHATGVIIDTMIRSVEGNEDHSSTVAAFSRYVGMKLKARHVTWIRADHLGKDKSRDARGSSAKNDDVDVVWQMAVKEHDGDEPDIVTMTKKKRRMAWIPKKVVLQRYSSPTLRHVLKKTPLDKKGEEIIKALDDAEKPFDIRLNEAKAFLRNEAHISFSNGTISSVLHHRRDR